MFFSNKVFPLIIITIFIAGFFIGIWFYWNQLMNTASYLWLFVIDCPIYVLLSAVIVALKMKNRSYKLLNYLTSVGLVKYGLWTILVMTLIQGDVLMFIVPHMIMVLFGFLLIIYSKTKFNGFLLMMTWFLFNDFMDYVIGTLPPAPLIHMELIMYFSVFSTVFFVSLAYASNRFILNQNR